MRNERRTARRANTADNPNSPGLSLHLPRGRMTGDNAGSPITPSTPPQGNRRLNNQSQSQNTGGFTSVNFSNALPSHVTPVIANGRRTAKMTHTYYGNNDDDDTMNNRMSLDSTTSTVTNSTVAGDSHKDESGPHHWTDHQIAVVVRTLEEGAVPSKDFIRNGLRAPTQANPNTSSAFKFLATWNPSAPAPPTTPYVLPRVPPGLIDRWARDLKKASDWPHDTRAIRMKLRAMAEVVAKEQGLQISPRKPDRGIWRSLGGGFSGDDGDIDEAEELNGGGPIMDYEQSRGGDDELIFSPIMEPPLPNGQRNDERVYKSSLNFQRNEDNIDVQGWKPVHSASYNRSRSPMKPHSPSPTRSLSREATISPTNSQFSFNASSTNDISPTKSTFGITPEKNASIGRYLSPLLPAATFTRPNRSRSISPSRGSSNASPSRSKGKGKDKPHPALPLSLQTPSLSPMHLSERNAQPGSVFATGSVRRAAATPYTVTDPSDLMRSIDGGRRDELDDLAGFRMGTSAGRAPIPKPFFTRDMMRSKGELGRREQQGQTPALGSDPFSSAGGDEDPAALASTATVSGSGATPYSSISSVFSNGSMRKVISGLAGKGSSHDISSSGTSSRKGSTSSNSVPQKPILQQPVSIHRNDPNPIVTVNKATPIPVIPSLAQTHPHLVETHANGRGLKRSASFSRPRELHKRAPSYGGPAKPRPQSQHQPPLAPELSPKTENAAHEPTRPRHKRERSDSSQDLETEYDTEDVPPSSAPSSDRIPQTSPLKSAVSWDSSSPSPEKMDKMYGATRKMLASPGKLLASPKLLFGRRKAKPKAKDQGDDRSGGGSVSPTPAREATASPVLEDDAMDIDDDLLKTPGPPPPMRELLLSPTNTASPMGGTTPRPRVMSTPRPTLIRKVSTDWDVPTAGGRYASAELRSVRQSPIEERREGEPRRKRVKTDELESPPPRVQGGHLGYNTRASSASRVLSPRAMSDGPARTFYKRSAASKTPPRRTAMPRSPRLLPGGGRTTPSRSPKTTMRQRLRSGDATPQASISQAASEIVIGPHSDHVRPTAGPLATARGTAMRPTGHAATATVSSASKARRSAQDSAAKPTTATTGPGKASSSKSKREPSFFGAELPTPQTSGTTRFPTATTASISSVLFPGGIPDTGGAQGRDEQMFDGIGSGEEGVIRAGENAAASRRADAMGKARATLRSSIGGSGRSRMTRSISMLGPGDSSRPY